MKLNIIRRVRDNVHGSIDLSDLEDAVISHRIFQRLRRVKQTAFLGLVFPGASHTRFEHSLGVMHQAGRAWSKLKDNQFRIYDNSLKLSEFAKYETVTGEAYGLLTPTFDIMAQLFSSTYIMQALRLAALLHDIGHPPFSHSGERFLPKLRDIIDSNSDLPEYLREYLEARVLAEGADTKANHEVYTLLLIERVLKDLYENGLKYEMPIDPQDVISIIEPRIAPRSGSDLLNFEVNRLCNELVSGEVDIDRMDYLLRDSRECGVVYGLFDVDRIMDSLALYYSPRDERFHLAIQYSGLATFEDYLRARQSMYLQLYFHKTSVAGEAMLQNIAKRLHGWHLPASMDNFVNLDESNIFDHLVNAARDLLGESKQFEELEEQIRDLLLDRKLWKKVYEFTHHDEDSSREYTKQACQSLKNLGVEYEYVSSMNAVTKFAFRRQQDADCNYLGLIKKDGLQMLRVVPIDKYSEIFGQKNVIQIERLYVARNQRNSGTKANVVTNDLTELLMASDPS